MYDPNDASQQQAGVMDRKLDGFTYSAFTNCDDQHNLVHLAEAAARFRPQALLGINAYTSALLSRLPAPPNAPPIPLWADLVGSAVLEAAAKARRIANDSPLLPAWRLEAEALLHADKVSAVSERQRHFVHGQLGALGRLNRHTFDYDFACVIATAVHPSFMPEAIADALADPASPKLKGEGSLAEVPADAKVLFWSGGYNAWTDVAALAVAVEHAMDAVPGLYYVSTGGAVHGHDDHAYHDFTARAAASRHASRFKLLGWIDAAAIPALTAQADIGLVMDIPNLETEYGGRTRAANMMAAGLPVLMTSGTEIGSMFAELNLVETTSLGEPQAFARTVAGILAHDDWRLGLRRRAQEWVEEELSFSLTATCLRDWAKNPSLAPDRAAWATAAAQPNQLAQLWQALNSSHPATSPCPTCDLDRQAHLHRSPLKRLARSIIGPRAYNALKRLKNP